MTQTAAVWLVVLAAVLGANLPFLSPRLLGVLPLKKSKSLLHHLGELLLLYALTGLLALALEQRAGQIAPQGWEFYAITATLFLTLAFPGFVYRYLLKRHA